MSYFVARRTAEIGIRMSLGATRLSVVAMVLRGAFAQIAIGLVLGVPVCAAWLVISMVSLLFGVSGYDPLAFIARNIGARRCAQPSRDSSPPAAPHRSIQCRR